MHVVEYTPHSPLSSAHSLYPRHMRACGCLPYFPPFLRKSCLHYGGLFIGRRAAEVLGDYGAGPNHVLPTGGTARYTGGLCVMTFLRVRTWMRIDEAQPSQALVR